MYLFRTNQKILLKGDTESPAVCPKELLFLPPATKISLHFVISACRISRIPLQITAVAEFRYLTTYFSYKKTVVLCIFMN